MNDCYLKKEREESQNSKGKNYFLRKLCSENRIKGFDVFMADGGQIKVDTTDFPKIDMEKLFAKTAAWKEMS